MWAMKRLVVFLFALIALPAIAEPGVMAPGIYTYEAQFYFVGKAGCMAPPWIGVRIEEAGDGLVWQGINRFGMVLSSEQIRVAAAIWTIGDCPLALRSLEGAPNFTASGKGCVQRAAVCRLNDGQAGHAEGPMAARAGCSRLTCKPIISVGGDDDSGAPQAIIRTRNVVCPPLTRNRP